MIPDFYPCPLAGGGTLAEYALACDRGRERRVLLVPALFDEANRLRRLAVGVMQRLDGAGVDSLLPDLPGCNESLQALDRLDPEDWRTAMEAAARHFRATHVLTLRGGALVAPVHLPGWMLAPAPGTSLLRTMLRARIVMAREGGREESQESLTALGEAQGLELAGYRLSAEFLRQFRALTVPAACPLTPIDQDLLGGGALWLRAEPDDDPAQADALAAVVAVGCAV